MFAGDELEPERSGGDIAVQACADDPQVAFHAVRNLARIGRGAVVMRWSQLGFGRTSSTSRAQETPRNLMGFKDGTNNVKLEDGRALAEHVWVAANSDPPWLRGGTYMVTRRIRMLIEVWDRASLDGQEQTIGRRKDSGAPFGREDEFDPSTSANARRRARPPGGAERERRSPHPPPRLLVHDGMDAELGQLDAGLSSSATRTTRWASSSYSGAWPRRTRSTSTSSTRAARSSPARRECGRAATSARRSSGSSQARG